MRKLHIISGTLLALAISSHIDGQVQLSRNVQIGGNTVGGVTEINGTSGGFTFDGTGVTCTDTTCTFTGLKSLNTLTGPDLSITSLDSSVGINASGTTIDLSAPGNFEIEQTAPVGGQSVFVPAQPTSSSGILTIPTGGPFEVNDSMTWGPPVLPSYIDPANVTAIYATATYTEVNYFGWNDLMNAPGEAAFYTLNCAGQDLRTIGTQLTSLTGATFGTASCSATLAANYSGGAMMNVSRIGYWVYYTGTAPPPDNAYKVVSPLYVNQSTKQFGLIWPFNGAVDTGSVNALAVTIPEDPSTWSEVFVSPAFANTSTTPRLSVNGATSVTIKGPTGGALVAGDITTTQVARFVKNLDGYWILENPQVSGGGGVVYPPAGVPNSTGSAWGTSYTVGTAANNLIQLNASAQIPAVSGALLTNLPFMSLTTTGTSGPATLSGGVLNIPQYTAGGGGITNINGNTASTQTFESLDSSVAITTPDGSHINLQATGGGGGGNPSTTAIIVSSFSGVYDDGDVRSRSLGVPSSVSCTGSNPTICTVAATAHGLAVKGAVDMSNLASWPVSVQGAVQQSAQWGSFQVTTVPDANHFTFSTPTSLTYSCSPCTGNIYDASYWGIWEFAASPNIYGHGTVYGLEASTQGVAANLATWTAGISGTPKILVDQSGQNDFASGRSVAQVEADHQTLWAAAHTAGMKVYQTTMVPSQYGTGGVGTAPGLLNYWYYLQTCTATTTASGQCIDVYGDPATALLRVQDGSDMKVMPEQQPNAIFASVLNAMFDPSYAPPIFPPTNFSISSGGLANDYLGHLTYNNEFFYSPNGENWMSWGQGGGTKGIDLYANTFNASSMIREWFNGLNVGSTWCGHTIGRDASSNDSFGLCFHYTGASSTTNYYSVRNTAGTDLFKAFSNGDFAIPGLTNQASIGTDANGKLIPGTGSSVSLSSVTPGSTGSGTYDFSAATAIKEPVSAGCVTTAQGNICYDSTNKNWHLWVNGVDKMLIPLAAGFTSGDCGQPTLSGTSWEIQSAGGPCGVSGGGSAFSAITTGTNTTATMTVGTGGAIARSGTGTIDANIINGVPFCTGFTPTTGQNLQYTTASSPNPCYTAAAGGSGTGLWEQIISQPTIAGLGLTTGLHQSGTFAAANNAVGITLSDTAGLGATDLIEGIVKAYPTPPFTFTVLVNSSGVFTSTNPFPIGIVVAADLTTGKLITCGVNGLGSTTADYLSNNEFGYVKWTNSTTFSAFGGVIGGVNRMTPVWLRYKDDGTNSLCQYSPDGINFQTLTTEVKASGFLGASGYNYLGLAIDPHNTSNASATFYSAQ
jgi:hypothetical protein